MFHNRIVPWLLILFLAAGLALVSYNAAAIPQSQTTSAVSSMYAVLNEVMPKPAVGEPAWVELYVGQYQQFIFLPAINNQSGGTSLLQVLPTPGVLPVFAAQAATQDLKGWQVSNEAGQVYTIPTELPPLPKNTYMLIYFDGSGPGGNDYDFSDGKIILHTPPGLEDIFADEAGQVALHRPGTPGEATIVDFVAWGGYSIDGGAAAVAAGLWGMGEAVSFENGFGDISLEDIMTPDELIGRFPGSNSEGALNWANYPEASLSPGAANPIQPVLFITPADGGRVDSATLSLSWRRSSGATAYRFQLDNDANFSSPLIDQTNPYTFFKPNPALAPGVYHWRINPLRNSQPGGWTAGFTIEVVNLTSVSQNPDINSPGGITSEVVLGIARVRQNKDSKLLGLDGAPEGDPTTDLLENAWDAAAPCTEPPCTDTTKYMHGNMYCVRASTRMVASYYNVNATDKLSMDRLSYYILQQWTGNTHPGTNDSTPDNDLGYNRGMYYPDEEDEIFSWALNFTYTTPGGKPSFTIIKNAIDADQPIMFRRPGHMMVIDGYRETSGGGQFLHVLDPDQPPDFERWQDYSTQTIDGYWIGPTGGPASGQSRIDENSVWTDSDGDGIMDFDEVLRFNLDPNNADSDGDWVPDKKDMREYVFNNAGAYSFRSSDTDSDGLRKELDPDNDNDGSPDGCEDTNYNGKYEAGPAESDNFDNSAAKACVPIFNILYPSKSTPINAGEKTAPQKILAQVSTAVPEGWSLSLTPGSFSAKVGIKTASVLAVYTSADTTYLVILPPTQTATGYYDLSISMSGVGTDSETGAVFYDPKAPNDEVIVLDRSGSMTSSNKIDAAQNAASAFVDFLSDGDWTGVTSFATSATTDYTLHEITFGSSIRDDAITAIMGLTATGSTALGQGMQQGQSLLTSAGHLDHDWSLVLLSDGWENVPPYWATVAPSITKSVVNTVALGRDADTILLQQIAAANNGTYFYVDVTPPASLASDAESLAATFSTPVELPNRLADVYLAIGELERGWQRLSERALSIGVESIQVEVPKGLPEAVFGLNWSDPAGQAEITNLRDPDGNLVKPDAIYANQTHQHLHVADPLGGTWQVNLRVPKPVDGLELFFTLSGKSETTLIAGVGGDPASMGLDVPVPIFGILTDTKPIAGASVSALVTGQGGSYQLTLYDDGKHGDGKSGDGLYANYLTSLKTTGGYSVKLAATGTNNTGEPFTLFASTGFNVKPRLAYIWRNSLDIALEYVALLEANNWLVDLIPVSEVTFTRLQPDELIIIGPDTGYTSNWGTTAAFNAIMEKSRPVLGLGEGGYSFFGKANLAIGYGNDAHGDADSIYWALPRDSIWDTPYNMTLTKDPLQMYLKLSPSIDILVSPAPPGVDIFGINQYDSRYAELLFEDNRFMLWGFGDGPEKMTEAGRRLFINTVFRALP